LQTTYELLPDRVFFPRSALYSSMMSASLPHNQSHFLPKRTIDTRFFTSCNT
jgi:hypothetical protein